VTWLSVCLLSHGVRTSPASLPISGVLARISTLTSWQSNTIPIASGSNHMPSLLDRWVIRDDRGLFLCDDGKWRNQSMTSICPSCWMRLYKYEGGAVRYAKKHFIKNWEVMTLRTAMVKHCGITLEDDKGGG
jgi:hypothetical protein